VTGFIGESLAASVMAIAPKLAAASPTSAAVSAGLAYLLVRFRSSDSPASPA